MRFISEEIEQYAIEKSNTPSGVCDEIELKTKEKSSLHHMMIGKLEASFIGFLIHSIGVSSILEIGTFTGYSAMAMAYELAEDGQITTVDKNSKAQERAKFFWSKDPVGQKITALSGDGHDVLRNLNSKEKKYDLIFIDADKKGYLDYLKLSLELVSDKGIIVIDNVLWSGRVVESIEEKSGEKEKSTEYLRELNDFIASSSELYGTLMPLRDGIFLVKKI